MDSEQSRKRPWLAALLAVVQPGLGHVYLREWVRSAVWFAMWVASVALVVPLPSAPAGGPVDSFLAVVAAVGTAPLESQLALVAVSAFSMADAYWLATRTRDVREEAAQCPHCGKEVDESLEFCHWCTEPLDEPDPTRDRSRGSRFSR